jgi:hypothetical protein
VSVELVKRNRRTARVRVYPSACSMGFVRLRFELSPRVDEAARALSPPNFWPPTRSGNAGERERDGMKAVNGDSSGAPVAGAAWVIEMVGSVTSAAATTTSNERGSPRTAVGGGVGRETCEGAAKGWERSCGLSRDEVTSNGSWLGLSCTHSSWPSTFLSLSTSIVLTLSSMLRGVARDSVAAARASCVNWSSR